MIERQMEIVTPDGRMNTFICHPERAAPHPVIIIFMDAPGIREELRDMARRLGTVGYYVMLPNLYYRANVEELGSVVGEANLTTRQRALQLMATINIPMVMQDVDALLAFTAQDKAASRGPMGCVGYCMSGQYAINAAVRHPERIRAAASMYGVALVSDKPDSPHLAPQRTDARLYFGCAEKDQYAPPEMIEQLRAEIASKGGNAEVEIYPGTAHGFAFPSRPVYDKPAAERHWERLFTLFGNALK
ncbi:MAG TPA: dienelactone hydrolase family protein [Steroidobacteraceae bacterium]|jgi:carboxymethylenebutenolidase|nr:dienelactone hydrolase family protein [Steroidobacteraceae bacterium]